MSDFDPTEFLDAATEQVSERMPNLPAGPGLHLDCQGCNVSTGPRKEGPGRDVSVHGCEARDRYVARASDYPTPTRTIVDGFIVNTREDNPQAIDYSPGKNGRIRQYREALGMNEAGMPFSPSQMIGRKIRVKTKLDPYEGEFFDKIDSLAKA